MNLTTEHPSAP